LERVRVQWRREDSVPALRDGDVLAWNYLSSETGTTGRSYLLLEFGVKLTIPPIWIQRGDPIWYVDLALVKCEGSFYHVVDLDVDVFVPTDDRPYRMVDLDEFADAIEAGEFALTEAMDGLRRWQRFLDTHLHRFGPGDVQSGWRDFPPKCIASLSELGHDAFEHAP
jgi:hypothetical protein